MITEKVYPGAPLLIKIEARGPAKRLCDADVRRYIVDSSGQRFPFNREARPEQDSYTISLDLPLAARPGKAQYIAEIDWKCNPLQRRWPYTVVQPGIEFEILETPAQGMLLQQYLPEQTEAKTNENPTRSPN